MKKYQIAIPAFTEIVVAEDEQEALEIFMFDYDNARQESEFNQPVIKELED